ncbi:MAG TPA: glycosyltransferase, partial [Puia sp.]|nr:glycosyltransferase [Puia sp.]
MKATVAVVIPFYNGHEYSDKLIGSIDKAAAGISCKVFIIDNSPEQMAIPLSVCNNLVVEIVRTQPAIGYGKACNQGFDLCRKEGIGFIIIANQDGYFSKDMIAGLLGPFEKDGS